MRKLVLLLAPSLLAGCLLDTQNLVPYGKPTPARTHDAAKKKSHPFALDKGTVFLADFDGNTLDQISGGYGGMSNGAFAATAFGSGARMAPEAAGKYIIDYANSAKLLISSGTMEALVRYDSVRPGFSHIIDKSWEYALSAYDGKLAAWWGSEWWYTDVALPAGKWSYVAAAFDGETFNLYLNGARVASRAYAGTGNPEASSGFDLGIGNAAAGGFDIPFNGTIDAVHLTSCRRSAAEIAATWLGMKKKLE